MVMPNSPQEVGRPDTSASLQAWIDMIMRMMDEGMPPGSSGPSPMNMPWARPDRGGNNVGSDVGQQLIRNELSGGRPAPGMRAQMAAQEPSLNRQGYHQMPDGSVMPGPPMPSRMPSTGGGGGFEGLLMQLLGQDGDHDGDEMPGGMPSMPPTGGGGVNLGPMQDLDPNMLMLLEMMLGGQGPTGQPYPRSFEPSILDAAGKMAGAPMSPSSGPRQMRNY